MCMGLFFFSGHCIKQIDSMLPWVRSAIDHRRRQNVVKTSVTHSPQAMLDTVRRASWGKHQIRLI